MLRTSRIALLALARTAIYKQDNPIHKAVVAVNAVTLDGFIKEPGNCSVLAREIDNAAGFDVYQRYHMGSARSTAMNFKGSKYVVHDGGLPGDVLFFLDPDKHGPDGHVVTRIYGNMAVENSIRYGENAPDGRGIQLLEFFGPPDMIVRTSIK